MVGVLSLDQPMNEDGDGLADRITDTDTITEDGFEPGSTGWEAETAGDDKTRRGRDNYDVQRRLVWDAVAERSGAPTVAAETLNEHHASRCRKTVREAGGVAAVIARWTEGHNTPELFAPFGSIDPGGEADIVATLQQHPAYADDMWKAAMSAAVTRRATSTLKG